MIAEAAFWKGRDTEYAGELTDDIRANAAITLEKVNELLARAGRSGDQVASGWRPREINSATANAASGSKHLTGEAIDVVDHDRSLATWVADNLDVLEECGLYCEDFRYTPQWVHFQIVPPKSGRRIFVPKVGPVPDPSFPVTWA